LTINQPPGHLSGAVVFGCACGVACGGVLAMGTGLGVVGGI